MNRHPHVDTSAPEGPLGAIRSWWQSRSGAFGAPVDCRRDPAFDPSCNPTPGAQTGEDSALRSHNLASLRVLVVDDDPFNLLLMTEQMAALGLVPELAADGAEALARTHDVAFDLILMDLQMPVLDGLAATAAIRHLETTQGRAAVPVIAYSSACVDAGTLASNGISGRLVKPCALPDLKNCLQNWCPRSA